jgi:hypothetical protein
MKINKKDLLAYTTFVSHISAQKPSHIINRDGKSLIPAKQVKDTKKK